MIVQGAIITEIYPGGEEGEGWERKNTFLVNQIHFSPPKSYLQNSFLFQS